MDTPFSMEVPYKDMQSPTKLPSFKTLSLKLISAARSLPSHLQLWNVCAEMATDFFNYSIMILLASAFPVFLLYPSVLYYCI